MNSHLIEPTGRCFQVRLLVYLWITGCVKDDDIAMEENQFKEKVRDLFAHMKKHLENEKKYEPILSTTYRIEENHKQLCKKIQDVITSEIPYAPSFQGLITNKIKSCCPNLSRTKNLDFRDDNIYIDIHVFAVIFETIDSGKSEISLSIQSSNHKSSILL